MAWAAEEDDNRADRPWEEEEDVGGIGESHGRGKLQEAEDPWEGGLSGKVPRRGNLEGPVVEEDA